MALITEEYRQLNAALHESDEKYGVTGHKWAKHVVKLSSKYECRSILDYGCGKQTLQQAIPLYPVTPYDPCIPGLDSPPIAHDLVVCGDVMEHIEEDCVDDVLDHLQHLALKCIFMTICTVEAQKTLLDGRNAHITLHDSDWWVPKLMQRWKMMQFHANGWGDGKGNIKIDGNLVFVGVPQGTGWMPK